jgi:hypothetical protein
MNLTQVTPLAFSFSDGHQTATLPTSEFFLFLFATGPTGAISGTTVTCRAPSLAAGASATITLMLQPTAEGTITDTVDVAANEPDSDAANNSSSGSTAITAPPPPALSGLTYNGGIAFVNGTNLIAGQTYTVTAQANASTRSVVFRRDGAVVKTDSAIPFNFTWTPTAIGTHTFAATPWSSTGGTGNSGATITVSFNIVRAPSPTPTPTP